MSERGHLTGELKIVTDEKLKAEQGDLEWDVLYDAQKEYADHLAFILSPYPDKLPDDIATEI